MTETKPSLYSEGRKVLEIIALITPFAPLLKRCKGSWWTRYVPNAITIARFPMTLLCLAAYIYGFLAGIPTMKIIGIVLAYLSVITDIWDGYLARLWEVESDFGKLVDPVVDKLFTFIAFPGILIETLLTKQWPILSVINVILVIMLLGLEFYLAYLNYVVYASKATGGSVHSGKIKYTIECITIIILAVCIALSFPSYVVQLILLIGTVPSIYFAHGSMKSYLERLRSVTP